MVKQLQSVLITNDIATAQRQRILAYEVPGSFKNVQYVTLLKLFVEVRMKLRRIKRLITYPISPHFHNSAKHGLLRDYKCLETARVREGKGTKLPY